MHIQIVPFFQAILPACVQLAALTETKLDDSVCELIRLAITNEQVAKWLQSLLDGGLHAGNCAGVTAPDAVMAALHDRKIDWKKLTTETLPQILKLVIMLT